MGGTCSEVRRGVAPNPLTNTDHHRATSQEHGLESSPPMQPTDLLHFNGTENIATVGTFPPICDPPPPPVILENPGTDGTFPYSKSGLLEARASALFIPRCRLRINLMKLLGEHRA